MPTPNSKSAAFSNGTVASALQPIQRGRRLERLATDDGPVGRIEQHRRHASMPPNTRKPPTWVAVTATGEPARTPRSRLAGTSTRTTRQHLANLLVERHRRQRLVDPSRCHGVARRSLRPGRHGDDRGDQRHGHHEPARHARDSTPRSRFATEARRLGEQSPRSRGEHGEIRMACRSVSRELPHDYGRLPGLRFVVARHPKDLRVLRVSAADPPPPSVSVATEAHVAESGACPRPIIAARRPPPWRCTSSR